MSAKFMRGLGYALGVVLIVVAISLLVVVGWNVARGMNAQLAIGVATFVGTVSLAVWNFNKTKEKEYEGRLFPQRAAIYQEVLDVLKEISAPQEIVGVRPDQNQTAKRLLDAKFKMIVWGSRETLAAFDYISDDQNEGGDVFAKMAYLMGCIRMDLGHKVNARDCVNMITYLIRAEDKQEIETAITSSNFYKNVLTGKFKPS